MHATVQLVDYSEENLSGQLGKIHEQIASLVAIPAASTRNSGLELEAVAVATDDEPDPYALDADLDVVRDLGGEGVAVWAVDPRGVVRGRVHT